MRKKLLGVQLAFGALAVAGIAVALWALRVGPPDLLWRTQLRSARVAGANGRYGEARDRFEAAMAEARRVFALDDPRLDLSVHEMAQFRVAHGDAHDAESLYFSLIRWRDPLGAEHPAVARALDLLGDHYRSQQRYSPAETAYRRALRIRQHRLGNEHPEVACSLQRIAELYAENGRRSEAARLCEQVDQILRGALKPVPADIAVAQKVCAVLRDETAGAVR